MQTINLKQYYPFCKEDIFVEVSDEIVETFLLDKRAEATRDRRMFRYKAFYSLDCNDGIENAAIGWAQPSPEDYLIEKEELAEYEELIRRLYEAISSLSPMQARRVHARYMLGIQSMQQLHEKIADMNTRYYDLRGKIVKAERRIAVLTERGEMWAQYNKYKTVHKQFAKVKPEKRELFEQRHSRELILYDAAARYLKELKASGEEITPKEWRREIDLLTAQKQVDSIDMKAMREELKAVERLRKAADQLARQERDKPRDRGPER